MLAQPEYQAKTELWDKVAERCFDGPVLVARCIDHLRSSTDSEAAIGFNDTNGVQ